MNIDAGQMLTVLGSGGVTALTLWSHARAFQKEKKLTLQEYAKAAVENNGLKRDIGHLKGDVAQLKENILHMHDEHEKRFRENETKIAELTGSIETYKAMSSHG